MPWEFMPYGGKEEEVFRPEVHDVYWALATLNAKLNCLLAHVPTYRNEHAMQEIEDVMAMKLPHERKTDAKEIEQCGGGYKP